MSDHNDAAERRAAHVAALRAEREGYERRGLADRAAQVGEQIARFQPEQVEQAPKRTTRKG